MDNHTVCVYANGQLVIIDEKHNSIEDVIEIGNIMLNDISYNNACKTYYSKQYKCIYN
jgi:hypothetical protein